MEKGSPPLMGVGENVQYVALLKRNSMLLFCFKIYPFSFFFFPFNFLHLLGVVAHPSFSTVGTVYVILPFDCAFLVPFTALSFSIGCRGDPLKIRVVFSRNSSEENQSWINDNLGKLVPLRKIELLALCL